MSEGPDWSLEEALARDGCVCVVGADEAGRGCLAGPVTAAAVCLPAGLELEGLDDSKRVPPEERTALAEQIREQAIAWAVASCSPAEIDRLNILWAAMEAMRRAICALPVNPDGILIDGNRSFDRPFARLQTVIGGDGRSVSIAAASILAKTSRDRAMEIMAERFPHYGWERNRGYPTPEHFEALAEHGPTPLHRRTFNLIRPADLQPDLFEAS